MTIPLDQGFTVVTGPNGSGKSNILDGVLFCLGLANSRGMRADRLPDLVNSGVFRDGKSAETIVSVRFDLSDWSPDAAEEGLEPSEEGPWIKPDQQEWIVTRKLRIMPGGSYSSSYASDGEPCNLQQLQTQLRRLRIDPEGSNVVMQGDVTRIVSMSNKDRRGLIDELAGVALFDNRIDQTRSKLDDVYEKQERCQIVQQELHAGKQKLERDCAKARTYQQLKEQLQKGKIQELVLNYEKANQGIINLKDRFKKLDELEIKDLSNIKDLENNLVDSIKSLEKLQENVKALGEDKLIGVQAELAGLDSKYRELERQSLQYKQEGENLQQLRKDFLSKRNYLRDEINKNSDNGLIDLLKSADDSFKDAEAAVDASRRRISDVAGRSGAWVEGHRERSDSRKFLQGKITPLQKEQQQLEERLAQDLMRKQELEIEEENDIAQNLKVDTHLATLEQESAKICEDISSTTLHLKEAEDALAVQQKTRNRLENEQVRLERDIARLDSRRETLQESRGTGALRLILEAGLEGIHGPVAQLGEVSTSNRLALEVAAGARLAHVVVDDDQIASKAIEFLKKRKAGRLTFLPLNRLKKFQNSIQRASHSFHQDQGLIGKAIDLIEFESIYADVFHHVFGETLVYKDLHSARKILGKVRAVTIEGELLEKSGAMTGGSFVARNGALSFGRTNETDESEPIRNRLLELGETLQICLKEENAYRNFSQENRPLLVQLEKKKAALEAELNTYQKSNFPLIERRKIRAEKLQILNARQEKNKNRISIINNEIKPILLELSQLDDKEKRASSDSDIENWNLLEKDLEASEKLLSEARKNRDKIINEKSQKQNYVERLNDQNISLNAEENRIQESINRLADSHSEWKKENQNLKERKVELEILQKDLSNHLSKQRRERDEGEQKVSNQRQKLQELQWQLERLREDREAIKEEIRSESIRVQKLEEELPDTMPVIPSEIRSLGLEALQSDLSRLQKRIEDLEPVNMLALEELEKLEKRLLELTERLEVLHEERSELLLRIENVATLRQEAFMEAFIEVDKHFREIFASLSDGDGHLQLENSEDPLEGGLTLVAHPKGKPVRRLAAMSGGEKSLTALSFLFALQKFRPSPFYALDEVDSFLDGVNVERLSSLIARQAQDAQFLVVSHRRPMIAASGRTIGVTQARGAHTQVVGLPHAA